MLLHCLAEGTFNYKTPEWRDGNILLFWDVNILYSHNLFLGFWVFFLQFLTSYKFLSWTESVGISAVSGLEAVDVEQERPRVLRG